LQIFQKLFNEFFIVFVICLIVYVVNFLFRFILFEFAIVYNDSLGGSNMDALFWTYKDISFLKKHPIGFSPIELTPIWNLVVMIFDMNFRAYWIMNFLIGILDIIFMFLILKAFNFSNWTKSIILLSSVISPYMLFSSLKIRPDNLAFLFALISLYLSLRNKPILSAISFSFSIFGFKIQFLSWLFIILFFNRKHLIKFLITFLVFSFIYYIFFFDYQKFLFFGKFGTNASSLFEFYKNITYQTPFSFLGFFSHIGLLYILGILIPIFYNFSILPPFPLRSLYSNFILNLSGGFLLEKNKFFRKIGVLLFSLQLIILIYKFILDIWGLTIEDKTYKMVYNLKNVCSREFPIEEYVYRKRIESCEFFFISKGALHNSDILDLKSYKIIYQVPEGFSIKTFLKEFKF